MTLTLGMVTVDTTEALPLARWWAEQMGGTIEQENDGFYVVVKLPGDAPRMAFQTVPDPTPGKNRIHLDLIAADLATETDRLVSVGAEVVDRQEMEGFAWNVFADPDGNRFCVAGAEDTLTL